MNTPKIIDIQGKNCCGSSDHQAYLFLYFSLVVLPIIYGFDKFFNILTYWPQYLSPPFNVFGNAETTLMVVGGIEICLGFLIWLWPRVFSFIFAIWILICIINYLVLGHFYDLALKDFGILLGALALGFLSKNHQFH